MARRRVVRQFAASIQTNGGSDAVTFADDAALKPTAITVESWVKMAGAVAIEGIVFKTTSNAWNDGYGLWYRGSGAIEFFVNDYATGNAAAPAGTLQFGRWHHVVGTYDPVAGKVTIYVDGVQVAQRTGYGTAITHSTNALGIGDQTGMGTSGIRNLTGARLWNRALTAAEVAALYFDDAKPSDSATSLVLAPAFTEIGLTSLAGGGSLNSTGTLSSASLWSADVPMVPRRYRRNLLKRGNTLSDASVWNAIRTVQPTIDPTVAHPTRPGAPVWKLSEDAQTGQHYLLYQTLVFSAPMTATATTEIRASWLIKKGAVRDLVALSHNSGGTTAWFDLTTGAFTASGGYASAQKRVRSVGAFWLVSVQGPAGASPNPVLYLSTLDASISHAGDAAAYLHVADISVQEAELPDEFEDTGAYPVLFGSSADPANTGTPRVRAVSGSRSQVSRQNLVTYSGDLTNAAWNRVNTNAPTDLGLVAPGGRRAFRMSATASAGGHYFYQTLTGATCVADRVYTLGVYVRAGTQTCIHMLPEGGGIQVSFDASAKTKRATPLNGAAYVIAYDILPTSDPNWSLCYVTFISLGNTNLRAVYMSSNVNSESYTDDGSGTLDISEPFLVEAFGVPTDVPSTGAVAINDGAAPKVLAA